MKCIRTILILGTLFVAGCSVFDKATTAIVEVVPAGLLSDSGSRPLKNDAVVQAAHYSQVAAKVDYADVSNSAATSGPVIANMIAPQELTAETTRPISLMEAIQTSLTNNQMIRVDGDFLSARNTLLTAPSRAPSVYDVAIRENGVLFGQRGEDAALSDFAPRVTTSMTWRRDETVQNNRFLSGGLAAGDTLYVESADFNSRVDKIFTNGSSVGLRMDWDYSLNNAPARLFGSAYTGTVAAEFRQPLWAGAGADFTGIAGPVGRVNQVTTGVGQGVVIARINTEISISEFKGEVRNQVFDVHQVYWDLYLVIERYKVRKEISRSLNEIWEKVKSRKKQGLEGGSTAEEAQAADNYYAAQAAAKQTLADVFETEVRLRRLLGLPSVDGKILLPTDIPYEVELKTDWTEQLILALENRIELRRQKMAVRSLQLQVRAAKSLSRPRADFIAAYRVNAFGDRFLSRSDNDGVTNRGLRSASGTLFQGDQTGWDLGFEVTVPLGFIAERAQIRNLEWQLAKAMTALSAQEIEIQHELRHAMLRLKRFHTDMRMARPRMMAAKRRVAASEADYKAGRTTLDLLLRARISSGEAQEAYLRALAEYNKSIANLAYRSGTIMEESNITVREGFPHHMRPAPAANAEPAKILIEPSGLKLAPPVPARKLAPPVPNP